MSKERKKSFEGKLGELNSEPPILKMKYEYFSISVSNLSSLN